MKNKYSLVAAVFLSLWTLGACQSPEPVNQDGSTLWLTNGRSYEEVLHCAWTVILIGMGKGQLWLKW